jgi:MYXO-CTERM domain-containing protein
MKWLSGACAVAAVLVLATEAHAHGCYPEANQLAFDPATGELALVRVTNVLIVRGDDGRWHWQCTEALDWRGARQRCTTPVAKMADGTLLSAAILSGMARSPDTGCEWTFDNIDPEAEESGRLVVIDQAVHPDDPASIYALSSRGGSQPNRLYLSEDNGESWAPTSEDFIDTVLFESVAVAPDNPDRIYLTGAIPPTADTDRETFVYRSSDGGATWDERIPFELRENERNIYLLEVDPTDPDHLFMYVLPETAFQADEQHPFRIVRSTDAGETWSDVDVDVPLLGGLAFSSDGSQVWIGVNDANRQEGALYRSDDGGDSFEQVPDAPYLVGCVQYHDDALWICANNWRDGFVVGHSTDGGDSFTPVFDFDDVHDMLSCPPDSHGREACDRWRCDINLELFGGEPEVGDDGEIIESDCPNGGGGGDGGTSPGTDGGADGGPGSDSGGGCGCAVASARGGTVPALAFALVTLAALLLRRRRSRSR